MNQIKVVLITYDRVEVHFADGTQGKHCVKQVIVQPSPYDRVEVLHFADGTQGKHCVKQVTVQPSRNRAPQPGWSYIREWQEINPQITYVHFEYMNPRCENFIK